MGKNGCLLLSDEVYMDPVVNLGLILIKSVGCYNHSGIHFFIYYKTKTLSRCTNIDCKKTLMGYTNVLHQHPLFLIKTKTARTT